MRDISPSEYMDVLRIAYHLAEKYYNQAVADVIAAEVRRDEAKKIKEEALTRLDDAREKYETPEVEKDSTTNIPASTDDTGTTTIATTNVLASADIPSTDTTTTTNLTKNVPASTDSPWTDITTTTSTTNVPASMDIPFSDTSTPTSNVSASTDSRPLMSPKRNNSFNNGETKIVRRKPIKKAIAESSRRLQGEEKVEESVANPNVDGIQEASPRKQRQSIATPDIILSPTAGRKKPPKIFLTNPESPVILSPTTGPKKSPKIFLTNPESPRRRSTSVIAPPLYPMDNIKGVLTIAQGRNRDWFDKNFDCEVHGLVKRFFQATFSTKTNEKTKKVTVKTIVLNDESNELVTDTSQIQEIYIGTSPDNDSKPTFRDRAAEALVNPPQQDPIALFFAPKRALNTNEIYYGGHWKVLDGEMLQPPRLVRGQLQQCLVRFTFVGIERKIVEAINKGI